MNNIKIEADKVIKSNPIIMKDTGMNKDGLLITIVDECLQKAREMHIETMNEFSQWLVKEKYILNYLNGKLQKPKDEQRPMSELYQMFLKSKEA
jgi:N12 class adenine-specific DNA methylase